MSRPRTSLHALQEKLAMATRGRVLIIDDDTDMVAALSEQLQRSGWDSHGVHDGIEGLKLATEAMFNVLIVDRMLPGTDGLSLVSELRARQVRTPVLFLTALGAVADRVAGLERGGDDYLVKPFAFAELNARVNVLAGRTRPTHAPTVLRAGDLVVDRLARVVRRGDVAIALLPLEFLLLEFLMLNAGIIVTRKMLLEKVWGFNFDPRTNIVETHISHLRRKIQTPGGASIITTVRGSGYLIGVPESQQATAAE